MNFVHVCYVVPLCLINLSSAGSDYFGASFTVTIPAGQTQVSQLVPIIEDVEAEGTERFQANLAIPSASADLGVTLGDGDIAVVDILDDDGVVVQFSPTHYTVSEDGGEVALTLVANLNASFDYTVEVNTVNGAATGEHVPTSVTPMPVVV